MAVPEQIPVVNYVADGVVKKFDVPFEYDQQSDLHVYVDGAEPTIDKYYFDGNAFNFYIAPINGQAVKIKRITPKERDTDYNLHTNTVRPKALNTDFDRLWYVLQEVFSDVGGLSQAVQDEIIARIQGDEDLLNQLTAEISARMLGDEAVTEDLKNYVDQVIGAIINDPDFAGIEAKNVNDASGETQQQVNYNGGSKWHSRVGGYKLNERVILTNGDIVKSTINGNANDPNVDMTGWEKPQASEIFDESGRSQQEKNNDYLQLKDYESLKVGDDWTIAIQTADDDAIAQNKCVDVAGGTYNYSGNITLRAHWFGSGLHCTRFRKTAPATITQLNGSIRDLTVSPDAQIVGDTTHGIVADDVDRKYIENVLTEKHGGDGFVYKRGNLSRFFLRSRSNGGRGVTFANDIVSGDNKACEVWFECSSNKKSGFYMEQHASNDVYNSGANYGMIISQNNGSDATVDDNYGVVLTGNGNNLNIYAEYNNASVWHRIKLKASNIFYSNMSHPTFLDEGDDSNIVSYIPSALGSRVTRNQKFEKWTIQKENASYSGKLALTHVANNTFRYEATLSSGPQYLELPSNLILRGANNSYQFAKAMSGGATLNFGSVPAHGSVERTVVVVGAVTSLQTAVIASPAGNIGNDLVWSAFVSAFDSGANTTTVTIRLGNLTASPIASTQLAWRVQITT